MKKCGRVAALKRHSKTAKEFFAGNGAASAAPFLCGGRNAAKSSYSANIYKIPVIISCLRLDVHLAVCYLY